MATNGNKRRRTATTAGDNITLQITDLPIGFLVDAASYLSNPSRALFAVAMSAPSTSWQNNKLVHHPSATTNSLSSHSWEVLDFEGIDKRLAASLSDDDIGAIVRCINAKHIKRLKLTGCVNIIGHGLESLRGSTVLELVDLSLTDKYGFQDIKPEPKISHEIVMPILNSIIAADGCSLRYILFPKMWHRTWTVDTTPELREMTRRFDGFHGRYHQMLTSCGYSCAKCNASMRGQWRENVLQDNVCHDCLKSFCNDCRLGDDERDGRLRYCCRCEKDYCMDCISVEDCDGCNDGICRGCDNMRKCGGCEGMCCEDCMNTCECCNKTRCTACAPFFKCIGEGCNKMNCSDCLTDVQDPVDGCTECDNDFCIDCQLASTKERDGEDCCQGCAANVLPMILKEITKLRKDSEELSKQNEDMAKLRKENEELRAKLERKNSQSDAS